MSTTVDENSCDCWAHLDKTSGSGDEALNVYFTENTTDCPRSVKIRICSTDGETCEEVVIVQKKTDLYKNDEMSAKFTKEGCDEDTEKGTEVTYTVPYGRYISMISKAQANEQAQADIDANGQEYANENGECITVKWYNEVRTLTVTKNDCDPDTEVGSEVTMMVEAGKFSSTVSQADANAQADAYLQQEAQEYANEHGICTTVKWYNAEKSGVFKRNNCDVTQEGTEVTYIVEYGTYSSDISQEDADAQAQADVDANGQDYANVVGECKTVLWYSEEASCTKTKNDCGDDYEGTEYTYTVTAGKYMSTISQEDANQQAQDDIDANCQAVVNENATCTTIRWWNAKAQRTCTKNDCDSDTQVGTDVTLTVDAGTYSSEVSQADADAQAEAYLDENCQTNANDNGLCTDVKWYNTEQKCTATRSDCAVDEYGTEVTYTVPAGTYSSTVSQADADQQAKDDCEANRQDYADENGECITNLWYSAEKTCTTTRDDCPDGYIGQSYTYTVPAGKYNSTVSQADADAKAEADIEENCQAMANGSVGCDVDPNYYYGSASYTFQKDDCEDDGVGGTVVVNQDDVTGGPFTSTISQADADSKALEAVMAQGQAIANEEGNCTWFGTYSEEFTKDDCEEGYEPSSMTVTQDDVTGRPFISHVSQDDANEMAKAAVQEQGQDVANDYGNCENVSVYIGHYSAEFTPNCDDCYTGTPMTVHEYNCGGPFASYESQEAADALAMAAVIEQGQSYADKNGECVEDDRNAWWTDTDPLVTQCSNCVSQKQQTDTNPCSSTYNTTQWVSGGDLTCEWTGSYSASFTRNDCGTGGTGTSVTVDQDDVTGGPFVSCVSQDDANSLAQAAVEAQGQDIANEQGTCSWSYTASASYTRNDCGTCENGQTMTVTSTQINGTVVTSDVSYADAQSKANEILESGGQDYVNKNGTCTAYTSSANWVDTGSTRCNGCTSQKQQRDTAECSSTYDTTQWVSGGSEDCSTNGTWGSTSYSCSGCTYIGTQTNSCGGTRTVSSTSNSSECGSYSATGYTCSGCDRYRVYTNSCNSSDTYTQLYESDSSACGSGCGCSCDDDDNWTTTGSTRCYNDVSQVQYQCSCDSSTEWRNEGSYCSCTYNCSNFNGDYTASDNSYCTETRSYTGSVTRTGSTTDEACETAESFANGSTGCTSYTVTNYHYERSITVSDTHCSDSRSGYPSGCSSIESKGGSITVEYDWTARCATSDEFTDGFYDILSDSWNTYCTCYQDACSGSASAQWLNTCTTNTYWTSFTVGADWSNTCDDTSSVTIIAQNQEGQTLGSCSVSIGTGSGTHIMYTCDMTIPSTLCTEISLVCQPSSWSGYN